MQNSFFINEFQKGSSENANIGYGSIVGFDVYSKKGVARLAKKSSSTTAFSVLPHFSAFTSGILFVQFSDGSVWYAVSGSGYLTWTDTVFPVAGGGNGLIYFQGYIFAFIATKIYYKPATATASDWVDWTAAKSLASLNNQATTPISGCHMPFLYPNQRGVYFPNGGQVGFFGQVGTTTFNPAGTLNTDFFYNGASLSLPSLTYSINTLNFLPPNKLAI